MNSRIIYLTGFMTSGKSTIGPILANVLGWDYYDLDFEIECMENRSIDVIFDEIGEKAFRNIESKKLNELSIKEEVVIALGGGTIVNKNNLDLIKKSGVLVYLETSPEVIFNRIKSKLDRPLFKDLVLNKRPKSDFIERIQEMLDKRIVYYNEADFKANTDNRNIGSTVDFIANKCLKILNEKNQN